MGLTPKLTCASTEECMGVWGSLETWIWERWCEVTCQLRNLRNGAEASGLMLLYRAELLEADDEALCCSSLRPGPSLSSPQSSMSTSLRERGTVSVPDTMPRRRPSPCAFSDSLRARRTETVGLGENTQGKGFYWISTEPAADCEYNTRVLQQSPSMLSSPRLLEESRCVSAASPPSSPTSVWFSNCWMMVLTLPGRTAHTESAQFYNLIKWQADRLKLEPCRLFRDIEWWLGKT